MFFLSTSRWITISYNAKTETCSKQLSFSVLNLLPVKFFLEGRVGFCWESLSDWVRKQLAFVSGGGISKKLEMLKLVEFDHSALFYDICEYRIS